MPERSTQENRGAKFEAMLRRPGVREFRYILKKLALKRYRTYRGLAEKMCIHPDPELLEDLVDRRTRQIEHFFNDPDDADPRASLAKAIEEAVLPEGVTLSAEEYGWDPSKP